jgi:hypothetical protein
MTTLLGAWVALRGCQVDVIYPGPRRQASKKSRAETEFAGRAAILSDSYYNKTEPFSTDNQTPAPYDPQGFFAPGRKRAAVGTLAEGICTARRDFG